MSEMYWITRLDGINTVLIIFELVLALVVAGCIIFMALSFKDDEDIFNSSKRVLKRLITPFCVSTLLLVFIPTKKDMLMIYGIGGTIDYIKSNEAATQIPDKCVNALDKLLDEYINEDNKDK